MRPAVLVFVVCAVACAAAHVAILVSVLRRRSATVDQSVPRPRLLVEIIWAVIPAIALAFVLTATWARVNDTGAQKPALIMKVAQ